MSIALYICFGVFLLILSVEDIRKRKIDIRLLLAGTVFTPFCFIFFEDTDLSSHLLGMIPGLLLLAIYFFSRGQIGIADVIAVIMLGVDLGIGMVVSYLSVSFLLIALFSGGMLILGKLRLKSRLPYIPFLFVGYVITIVTIFCKA